MSQFFWHKLSTFQAHSCFAYHTSLTWNAIKVKCKRVWQVPFLTHLVHCNDFPNIYNVCVPLWVTKKFFALSLARFRFFFQRVDFFPTQVILTNQRKKKFCSTSQYDRIKRSESVSFAISKFWRKNLRFSCRISEKSFGLVSHFHVRKKSR